MYSKEAYIELCNSEKSIPIFSQYWWLDAVCGTENWEVILIFDPKLEYEIIASFPYYINRRFGFKRIKQPILTQKLGIWLKQIDYNSENDRLSYEKDIFSKIISLLPNYCEFNQHFNYTITNWLPFYWKGFKQTTRYTYIVKDIKNFVKTHDNFDRSKKKNIRKALKNVHLEEIGAEDFYDNHKLTLSIQGQKILYSFEVFNRIHEESIKRSSGKIFCAKDDKGNIHAALFVIWDNHSAYDLISTIDPRFRNSGAADFLVYEAIRFTSNFVNVFDFEGSMIEGVERSFRKFGSYQTPYFAISKINSKRLKLAYFIKESIKK